MDGNLIPVATMIFGAAVGAVIVWLFLLAKTKRSFEEGKSESATQIAALDERVAAKDQELTRIQGAFDKEVAERDRLREDNAKLKADFEGERRAAHERNESFKRVTEELAEKFKALSRDALKDNNQVFLTLASVTLEKFRETAKGDLELRQSAIDQLVKPLKESLERVDGKIGELEKARAGAYAELREQVRSLATTHLQLQAETGNLVKGLRAPHVRGRWGEIQLRRVVEMAGMLDYCDFEEQASVDGDNGRQRPDLVVRLPGGKTVIVDAKAPLAAYLDAVEGTGDETARELLLKDHARQVRDHMTGLGSKAYWNQFQPAP